MSRSLLAGTTVTGLFLLAPAVTAQIGVTPQENSNAEGSSVNLAFQVNQPSRLQVIYEASKVYRPFPQWNTLFLRPDDGFAQQVTFTALTRPITIRMSTNGVPSPELASQSSFSANYGTDLTEVLSNKPVSFPAYTPDQQGPAPFLVTIPLDRPFSLVPYAGHLLIEMDLMPVAGGPANWRWYPDAEHFPSNGWTVLADTFGTGCPSGGNGYSVSFDSSTSMLTTYYRYPYTPANPGGDLGVAWFGTSRTNWGGLPLPFPLDFLGATGCSIYTEPSATVVGMTLGGSGKNFIVNVPVPRNFSLLGKRLYSQTMMFDSGAGNPAGVRVSQGGRFVFSTPPSPLLGLTLFDWRNLDDTPQVAGPNDVMVIGAQ